MLTTLLTCAGSSLVQEGGAVPPRAAAPAFFGTLLLERCAGFTWPLLACSLLVWALGLARCVDRRLDPEAAMLGKLGSLSVSFGLLGTVVGMIGAFAEGQEGDSMARSIAVAYWTTGFGIVNSIAAHVFGLRSRGAAEVRP